MDHILSKCTAGGVEITGLHAAVAPRRHQQHTAPTLEYFTFVPYSEHIPQTKHMKTYRKHCEEVSGSIVKSLVESVADFKSRHMLTQLYKLFSINGYYNGNDSGFHDTDDGSTSDENSHDVSDDKNDRNVSGTMMTILNKMKEASYGEDLSGILGTISTLLEDGANTLLMDRLYLGMSYKENLKVAADLVLENAQCFNLKIVEVYPSFRNMMKEIATLLNSQPMVEAECIACHAHLDDVDTETSTHANVEWDINKAVPPTVLNCDLLILDNILHLQSSPKETIKKALTCVGDEGFLLVCVREPTCLSGIMLDVFTKQGSNLSVHTADEWRSMFLELHLEVVAERTDNLTGCLFLLRRVAEKTPKAEIVEITEENFMWVKEVQVKVNSVC